MVIYWNLDALVSALPTLLIFVISLVLQVFWTRSAAHAVSKHLGADEKGVPFTTAQVAKNEEFVRERIGLDADRVQLAVTLATVPISLLVLFDWAKSGLVVLFVVTLVMVAGTFALLGLLPVERNRLFKLKWLSVLSLVTGIGVAVYTLALFALTPPMN